MRKYFIIFFLLPTALVAQNDVLNRFFQTLNEKTLQADFRLTVSKQTDQPISYNGEITMRGEKFMLTMGDMQIAYDGTTLYHYSESLDELTLSTPTEDEILTTNPLFFARALSESCTIRQQEANGNYIFTLTPDISADVQQFTLHIRKNDLLPLKAVMKESAQDITTLQLLNAKYVASIPSFILSKEGAFINDLR